MYEWIVGEYKGSDGKWYEYLTSCLEGESLSDAIKRIKKANPKLEFRNLHIVIG